MNPKSARLGEESIGKLLLGLSMPAAIAMMVNGLYNVVDAIFIGKGFPALILSLLRQFILLTPLILVLPRLFNLGLFGIWLAFPIADILAAIITVYLLKRTMDKISLEVKIEQ